MSFPEAPLLIYPSHAREYGVEEALLYSICYQYIISPRSPLIQQQAVAEILVEKSELCAEIDFKYWQSLTNIWSESRLRQLIDSLAKQQLLSIEITGSSVFVKVIPTPSATSGEAGYSDEASAGYSTNVNQTAHVAAPSIDELTQVLPVYDAPPAPAAMPLPKRQQSDFAQPVTNSSQGMLKERGPAPSFGGSTGWKKRSGDALQTLFAQQEVLNKQLHPMSMGWKPSAMFYSTLRRNNITEAFADNCLDEFILFYCDKNTKERSWDQKFLAWVKRAWIKQQTVENRTNTHEQPGSKNENSQRDTREKRKRITAAIMDIHDTNW